MDPAILDRVRAASGKKTLYLPHALRQMVRPDRMIGTHEIRPVHVVCSPKDDYLAIITAYLPDEREWAAGFRKRRSP